MSIGSAFDARVKSNLHEKLFGKGHKDSARFDVNALFEAQVEQHNREWAWEASKYVFEKYRDCGALADLMLDLNKSVIDPRFEMQLEGVVDGYREGVTKTKGGVPLLGKPDLYYINEEGAHVIHDWKVNGFCSKSPTSPMAGYLKVRDAYLYSECSATRGGEMHKDCIPARHKGMEINGASNLEYYNEDWASQLSIYGWVLGEPVGAELICSIDQIVCKPRQGRDGYPFLRVASHRALTSEHFQFTVLANAQNLWGIINEEPLYFFRNLSFEQSKAKCELLDMQSETLYGVAADLSSDEQWLIDSARPNY